MGKRARRRRRGKARGRALASERAAARALVPMADTLVPRREGRRKNLRLVLRMGTLEIAKGHDGFLRGMPEPVVLLGAYCLDERGVQLIGRYAYHFERPGRLPDKVQPREPSDEQQVFGHLPDATLAIVALAIEEDSGRGVQEMFAALHNGDAMVAWPDDFSDAGAETGTESIATPLHLDELPENWLGRGVAQPVQVLFDGRDPSRELTGDDWIAATIALSEMNRGWQNHRFRFVSRDGRNDWSAAFDIALRWA